MSDLILDGTKIEWYPERIREWQKGKLIAPITVDMALTRSCNYKCVYCYGVLQENKRYRIDEKVIKRTYDDFAEIGVKGVSLVSDGESTCSPHLEYAICYGKSVGLAMALGTNGYNLSKEVLCSIVPRLTYLRFNISAGTKERYNEIMRPRDKEAFNTVCNNIVYARGVRDGLFAKTTVGMQMVLLPEFADQIIPLSKLALELGVDYLVIKHCSDDENGSLGVDYTKYKDMYELLQQAESLSTAKTKIVVKWNKLKDGNARSYQQCYGPPFILQISGSGLVAPCGMFFNEKYKDYHIGNITKTSFKTLWKSKRYWSVMTRLWDKHQFNARSMCGCLCLQHSVNKYLDKLVKGETKLCACPSVKPQHIEFV